MGEKPPNAPKARKSVKILQQATVAPLNLEGLAAVGNGTLTSPSTSPAGLFYSTPAGIPGATRGVNVSKVFIN